VSAQGPVIVIAPLPSVLPRGRERVELQRDHARRAVHRSSRAHGAPVLALRKNVDDVPQPDRGWHWSLSHSPTRVAGVVSTSRVGVDVEEVRVVRADMIDRILDEREKALFASRGEDGFLRTWTGKEALLKEFGVGLQALSRCRIERVEADTLELRFDLERRIVHQRIFTGYVVSFCSPDSVEPCYEVWDAPLAPSEELAS
jgi:4'-phosphopantetheinyl transferase